MRDGDMGKMGNMEDVGEVGNMGDVGNMRDAGNWGDVGSSPVSSLSHTAQPPLGGHLPATVAPVTCRH